MRMVLSANTARPHQLIAGSWWEGRPVCALSIWEGDRMTLWENCSRSKVLDQSRTLVHEENCDSIYAVVDCAIKGSRKNKKRKIKKSYKNWNIKNIVP